MPSDPRTSHESVQARNGFFLDAGLADTATGKCLAVSVNIRTRHRSMAHPELLIGPTFLLCARPRCLTKQGPLRAIGDAVSVHEVCRDIPPLDPEIRMRTVIRRKSEGLARCNGCESLSVEAESGKALRKRRPAAEPEKCKAAREGAAGYRLSVHRRRS